MTAAQVILDSRRKAVRLYRLDQTVLAAGRTADLSDAAFARIRERLLAQRKHGFGRGPVLFLVIAGFVLANIALGLVAGARWWTWGLLAVLGIFLFRAATYRYRIPRVGRESVIAAMLAERRCASCAYDLSATAPDPDGLATCPECGAAWHIPNLS